MPAAGLSVTRVIPPVSTLILVPAPAASIRISSKSIAAVAGYSFSGPIATFVDNKHPGTDPASYDVTIDWGDGTTSKGDVAYDPNLKQFIVSSSHTFARAAGSTADLNLTILDKRNGNVAGKEEVVPLQVTTAPPALIQFDGSTFTVNRNGSSAIITVGHAGDTSLGATVDYHASGSSAVDGVDYQAESGTLDFAPGQTSRRFTLPIYADPVVTTDQTVDLVLSIPTSNAKLGSQTTTELTIHPSIAIFAPLSPTLAHQSDTGANIIDSITANNGTAKAPLTLNVNGTSIPNGFVQLYDVTDPAHPVALGVPVQASHGNATILVQGTALADGVRKFAVTVSQMATSSPSPLSPADAVTIDTTPPTSTVAPLPAAIGSTDFTVRWSSADVAGVSGLTHDVSVSDNGGSFSLFLHGTADTSATFHGTNGHDYGFFSVATDPAGNVQATPTRAQATTSVAIPTLALGGAGSVILRAELDEIFPQWTIVIDVGPYWQGYY